MFKSALYGFFIGCAICGATWFSIGRNDIRPIRESYKQIDIDFKEIQQFVNQLTNESDGFTKELTSIADRSGTIKDRSITIRERLTIIDNRVAGVISEVDKLERWNREAIIVGRDLSDLAYTVRQIYQESKLKK